LSPEQEYTLDVFNACRDAHHLMVSLDRLAPNGGFTFWYNGGGFNMTRLMTCMKDYGFEFK
jgi:hypothetical protein